MLALAGGSDNDDIEVISPGEYFERNGAEFLLFEEHMDDTSQGTRNLVKIEPGRVSILKKGLINSDMVFEKGVQRQTHYTTPFGSVVLGITADNVAVERRPDEMKVELDYRLEINYEHYSECSVYIHVQSAEKGAEAGV